MIRWYVGIEPRSGFVFKSYLYPRVLPVDIHIQVLRTYLNAISSVFISI